MGVETAVAASLIAASIGTGMAVKQGRNATKTAKQQTASMIATAAQEKQDQENAIAAARSEIENAKKKTKATAKDVLTNQTKTNYATALTSSADDNIKKRTLLGG